MIQPYQIIDNNLPSEIIHSGKSGKLIIITGSGISIDSEVPSYKEFIHFLYRTASIRGIETPEPYEPFDRYLEELHSKGLEVHQLTKDIFKNGYNPINNNYNKYKPNSNHKELVNLFTDSNEVRLITLNYDNLLTIAANEIWGENKVNNYYYCNKLPDPFNPKGIINIHGSAADSDLDGLVITETDYSRAYTNLGHSINHSDPKGFVARFMNSVLSDPYYTKLFVGASYSDPLITYILKGISISKSYVLVGNSNSDTEIKRWLSRDIKPLIFKVDQDLNNPYSNLTKILALLGKGIKVPKLGLSETKSNLTYLNKQSEINKLILKGFISLNAKQIESLIEDVLSSEENTLFFIRNCNEKAWLDCLFNSDILNPLFDTVPIENNLKTYQYLSAWVTEKFLGSYTADILRFISVKDTKINHILWFDITVALNRLETNSSDIVRKWVPILIATFPQGYKGTQLTYLLEKCTGSKLFPTALMLIDFLSKPFVRFNYSKYKEFDDFEIAFKGDEYWLNDAWYKITENSMDYFSEPVLNILRNNLEQIHYIYSSYDKEIDRYQFKRPCIENDEQNRDNGFEAYNFTIDVIRDCLSYLINNRIELGNYYLNIFLQSDKTIFQRIGLYGLKINNSFDNDEKLRIITENNWLFSTEHKPEVFQLLKRVWTELNETQKLQFYNNIEKSFKESDDKDELYTLYNILVWLKDSDKITPREMFKRVSEIESQNNYEKRERPDLNSVFSTSGWLSPAKPFIKPEELISLEINNNLIQRIINEYKKGYDSELKYNGKDRVEAALRQSVKNLPDWSLSFIQYIAEHQSDYLYLLEPILRALDEIELSKDQWNTLLVILNNSKQIQNDKDLVWQIANIFSRNSSLPNECYVQSLKFIIGLWDKIEALDDDYISESDYLTQAINYPTGKISEFLISILNKSIKAEDRSDADKVIELIFEIFELILDKDSHPSNLGKTILTSRASFIRYHYPDWFSQKLRPLFSWVDNHKIAKYCWAGYLYSRLDTNTFSDLKEYYFETFNNLSDIDDNALNGFTNHVALYLIHSEQFSDKKLNILDKFLQSESKTYENKLYWSIDTCLEKALPDQVENAWNNWLKVFINKRLNNHPILLSSKSSVNLLEIILSLTIKPEIFSEAVELVIGTKADIEFEFGHKRLLYDLSKKVDSYPEPVSKLLLYILKKTTFEGLSYDNHYVLEVFKSLIKRKPYTTEYRQRLLEVCNEMARLRFSKTLEYKAEIEQEEIHSDAH